MFLWMPSLTHVAVGDEVLLPLQHHSEVAHGDAELLGIPVMVGAVQRLLVLTANTHTHS